MKRDDTPIVNSLRFDAEEGVYIAEFDKSHVSSSTAVIFVLSEIVQTSVTDLPPLNDVIEPDALDQLVGSHPSGEECSDIGIEFVYLDYTVHVLSGGVITVYAPDL